MAKTHFKKLMNPNYLGSFAFEEGEKKTVTVKTVGKEKVVGEGGSAEDCIVCHWVEDVLPMIMNATNCKKLAKLTGSPFIEDWAGKRIVLATERIRAFGDTMDAVRVQKLADGKSAPAPTKAESKGSAPICEMCENPIKAEYGMSAEEIANKTKQTYGKVLCPACAAQLKAANG